jgi:hypothetical protein
MEAMWEEVEGQRAVKVVRGKKRVILDDKSSPHQMHVVIAEIQKDEDNLRLRSSRLLGASNFHKPSSKSVIMSWKEEEERQKEEEGIADVVKKKPVAPQEKREEALTASRAVITSAKTLVMEFQDGRGLEKLRERVQTTRKELAVVVGSKYVNMFMTDKVPDIEKEEFKVCRDEAATLTSQLHVLDYTVDFTESAIANGSASDFMQTPGSIKSLAVYVRDNGFSIGLDTEVTLLTLGIKRYARGSTFDQDWPRWLETVTAHKSSSVKPEVEADVDDLGLEVEADAEAEKKDDAPGTEVFSLSLLPEDCRREVQKDVVLACFADVLGQPLKGDVVRQMVKEFQSLDRDLILDGDLYDVVANGILIVSFPEKYLIEQVQAATLAMRNPLGPLHDEFKEGSGRALLAQCDVRRHEHSQNGVRISTLKTRKIPVTHPFAPGDVLQVRSPDDWDAITPVYQKTHASGRDDVVKADPHLLDIKAALEREQNFVMDGLTDLFILNIDRLSRVLDSVFPAMPAQVRQFQPQLESVLKALPSSEDVMLQKVCIGTGEGSNSDHPVVAQYVQRRAAHMDQLRALFNVCAFSADGKVAVVDFQWNWLNVLKDLYDSKVVDWRKAEFFAAFFPRVFTQILCRVYSSVCHWQCVNAFASMSLPSTLTFIIKVILLL